jgi:hypothetical protein
VLRAAEQRPDEPLLEQLVRPAELDCLRVHTDVDGDNPFARLVHRGPRPRVHAWQHDIRAAAQLWLPNVQVAHVHEERHGLLQIFPERYLAAPAVVALCTIATWGFVAGRFLPSIARNCPPLHHEPLGRLRSKPRTTRGEACGSIEPLQHHLRLRLDAVLQLLPSLKGGEGATVHDVPGELELLDHSGIHGLVLHLVCRELQGDGGVAKRAPAEAAQTHGESKVVSRVVLCTYKQQPRHKRNAGCPRKLRDPARELWE